MTTKRRSYSELVTLPTFEERFRYLKLEGKVGEETFGFNRMFNQRFYTSKVWRRFRRQIILRDNACDLGIPGRPINPKSIYIHHIRPLTIDQVRYGDDALLDPDNVICCSYKTHKAIHYGSYESLMPDTFVERRPNDTCPWKD